MTETLLSPSNVLLFGRVMADLAIVIPTGTAVTPKPDRRVDLISTAQTILEPFTGIDGVAVAQKQRVLLTGQHNHDEDGLYIVKRRSGNFYLAPKDVELRRDEIIFVRFGANANQGFWELSVDADGDISAEKLEAEQGLPNHNPFRGHRKAGNRLLQKQIRAVNEADPPLARFARIYGFSYEGAYYDLPRPMLFLVHGEGEPATEVRTGLKRKRKPSRAPGDPSLTGLAAAEFEFADDIMVWSYDKADYTIRMDVETGMLEQVLLSMYFGGGPGVSGAHVSGAHVSGAHVSGAHVSGAHVSGAHLAGQRGRGRGRGGTD